MRLDHRLCDRHAKTASIRFSMRHERLEELGQEFRRNANARVGYSNQNVGADEIGRNGEDTAMGHRFAGILHKVAEREDCRSSGEPEVIGG